MIEYEIRNFRSEKKPVFTDSGSGIKIEYQLRIVDGKRKLVEVGKTSLYDYIQSHADSVDIHKILERCSMENDYSYLNRMPSDFMDVTDMPRNLAEAYSAVQDAKNYFNRMPIDIKKEYNNSFGEFITDLGTKHFNDTVTRFIDSVREKEEFGKGKVITDES